MFWIRELLASLGSAGSAEELFARISKTAGQLGFSSCSYGLRLPVPASKPQIRVLDNYPRDWMRHYQRSGYLQVDPTVSLGMSTNDLVIWNDKIFKSAPALWHDARSIGLNVGLAQPAWGPGGSFGLLSLSREAEAISISEVAMHRRKLIWLTQAVHASMHTLMIPHMIPEGHSALTARECEIIRWTADGKTSEEVAVILGVSIRTVNFHIQNALGKLNSSNKIQAAVKAVALGLVQI